MVCLLIMTSSHNARFGTEKDQAKKRIRSSDHLCRSAGDPREACGERPACWHFRATHLAPKREQAPRTYSSPKVIHRWRMGASQRPLPPPVNNFGGVAKMSGEQLTVWLNRKAEHAGPGRRIPHSNVSTFIWRLSLRDPAPCRKGILRTLRLQVQTCQRRTSISASIRQGRRAQCVKNHNSNHEYID